jgi:hypothetical protein
MKYKESVDVMETADVPADVRRSARRNPCSSRTRRAGEEGRRGAKEKATAYAKQAVKSTARGVPQHELAGLIALEEKRPADAVAEPQQSNQQDPRIVYPTATALQAKGRPEGARNGRQGRSVQRSQLQLRLWSRRRSSQPPEPGRGRASRGKLARSRLPSETKRVTACPRPRAGNVNAFGRPS